MISKYRDISIDIIDIGEGFYTQGNHISLFAKLTANLHKKTNELINILEFEDNYIIDYNGFLYYLNDQYVEELLKFRPQNKINQKLISVEQKYNITPCNPPIHSSEQKRNTLTLSFPTNLLSGFNTVDDVLQKLSDLYPQYPITQKDSEINFLTHQVKIIKNNKMLNTEYFQSISNNKVYSILELAHRIIEINFLPNISKENILEFYKQFCNVSHEEYYFEVKSDTNLLVIGIFAKKLYKHNVLDYFFYPIDVVNNNESIFNFLSNNFFLTILLKQSFLANKINHF